MAILAIRADFAVTGLRLGSVALGARSGGARARMRLMAALAGLMTGGRRRALLLVARAARGGLFAVVWVVATDALGVRRHHPGHLCRVARATGGDRQERPMRQPRVTILAVLVPRQARNLRQFLSVTIEAPAVIGSLAHEIMRRVAALAVDTRVKARVLGGRLMAVTARARASVHLRATGMRLVTSGTAGGGPGLGVIGVNVAVTFGAGLLGSAAHVVRGMTARALLVPRRVSAAQNSQILVARAARRRIVFGELVRAMTAHALPMAGLEQRGGGHDRRLLRVTRDARSERFRSGGVLLLVTRGAGLNDRTTRGSVGRRHVLVAVGAGCRDRFCFLVRPVAVEAFFGVVNLHGWRRALSDQMTMRAVAGRVRVGVECLPTRQPFERVDGRVFRETMAEHAIALGRACEALSSFVGRVRQLRLLLVTLRAALGSYRADLAVADGVALIAGHVLLHDVQVVTAELARRRPGGRNVDAQPRVRRARRVTARARRDQ